MPNAPYALCATGLLSSGLCFHPRPETLNVDDETLVKPLRDFLSLVLGPDTTGDTPPIDTEFMEPWLPPMVRYANAALLMIDCTGELLAGVDIVIDRLRSTKVHLRGSGPAKALEHGHVDKRVIVAANKIDAPGATDNLEAFVELYGDSFDVIPISLREGVNIDLLKRGLFDTLEIIRVYTKSPGKKPDLASPFICRRGDTVIDLAGMIHKDIRRTFKSAQIWSEGKYDGQLVQRDHVLADEDIIEVHA